MAKKIEIYEERFVLVMSDTEVSEFKDKLELEHLPLDVVRNGKKIRIHRELTALDAYSDYGVDVLSFVVYANQSGGVEGKPDYDLFFVGSKKSEPGHAGINTSVREFELREGKDEPESGGIIRINEDTRQVSYGRDSDRFGVADKDVVLALMEYAAKVRGEGFEVVEPEERFFEVRRYRDVDG